MPEPKTAADAISRLNRIAGQARGVARMLEEGRYCIEILTQLRAMKAALGRVEDMVLKEHAATCVAQAIRSGDAAEQRKKFEELIELLGKFR